VRRTRAWQYQRSLASPQAHHAHGVEGAAGVHALLGLSSAAEGLGASHGGELDGGQGAEVEGDAGAKVGGAAALDQGQGGVVPVAVACAVGAREGFRRR
jgi:hypothetical protein